MAERFEVFRGIAHPLEAPCGRSMQGVVAGIDSKPTALQEQNRARPGSVHSNNQERRGSCPIGVTWRALATSAAWRAAAR